MNQIAFGRYFHYLQRVLLLLSILPQLTPKVNPKPDSDSDTRSSERTADVREDEEEDVLFRELAYLASKGALATDDASISRTIDKVKQRVKAERAENARTISQLRQLLAAQGKPSDGKIFTKTSINNTI